MRKHLIVRAVCGVALAIAVTGMLTGRAAAQDRDTPWLGVTTQEITRDLRDGLDYQGSGLLVNRVVADSPADRAGLEKGDVIVSFNSRTVTTPQQLTEMVRSARVGQSVTLSIVRDGSRRTITARLGSWPEDSEDVYSDPDVPEPPSAPEPPTAPRAPSARSRININGWDMPEINGPGVYSFSTNGRGRLGVQIQDLNDGLAEALGVTERRGVLVIEVIKDTPAERAGMKAGDVITRVGDRTVENTDDLRNALGSRDGRVSLTVVRKGVRRTIEAELEARPRIERMRSGDGSMMFRIPDVRTRVLRDLRDRSDDSGRDTDREAMQRELRELRDQVRELRRRLEQMDHN